MNFDQQRDHAHKFFEQEMVKRWRWYKWDFDRELLGLEFEACTRLAEEIPARGLYQAITALDLEMNVILEKKRRLIRQVMPIMPFHHRIFATEFMGTEKRAYAILRGLIEDCGNNDLKEMLKLQDRAGDLLMEIRHAPNEKVFERLQQEAYRLVRSGHEFCDRPINLGIEPDEETLEIPLWKLELRQKFRHYLTRLPFEEQRDYQDDEESPF